MDKERPYWLSDEQVADWRVVYWDRIVLGFQRKDYYWLKPLLAAGIDVNLPNIYGVQTLMHQAVLHQATVGVRLLIKHGANINVRDDDDITPLRLAVQHCGDQPEIIRLLLKAGADPNEKHSDRWSLLFMAIHGGYVDAVSILLEFGADPHYRDQKGRDAQKFAEDCGHPSAALPILDHLRQQNAC